MKTEILEFLRVPHTIRELCCKLCPELSRKKSYIKISSIIYGLIDKEIVRECGYKNRATLYVREDCFTEEMPRNYDWIADYLHETNKVKSTHRIEPVELSKEDLENFNIKERE